jgi:hypothetical protein
MHKVSAERGRHAAAYYGMLLPPEHSRAARWNIPTAQLRRFADSQIRLDDDGRILEDDLACFSCGYNLRGLSPDGACPECGATVERSTRDHLLRFCDPKWVDQLASGMKLLIVPIPLAGLFGALAIRLEIVRSVSTLAGAVLLILAVLSLIGCWKLTTPDPGQLKTAVWLGARRVTRAAIVAVFVLSMIVFGPSATSVFTGGQMSTRIAAPQAFPSVAPVPPGGQMTGAIRTTLVVVLLVAMFAAFIYARQLANRIPDTRLANYTRWVMWAWVPCSLCFLYIVGIPSGAPEALLVPLVLMAMAGVNVMYVIDPCVGISTLITALLSPLLAYRYKKAFNHAARQARATWAA